MHCTTPLRYGTVEINLYRGAYPTLRTFRFLKRLKLKYIISLTPEPPTADVLEFCSSFGIESIHIQVVSTLIASLQVLTWNKGLKTQPLKFSTADNFGKSCKCKHELILLLATQYSATQRILELKNAATYIHCLDGKRITGLLVLLLRRLQGYNQDYSLGEYVRHATHISNNITQILL